MLNKTILIGRLVKDPELRHTQSGNAVASFVLAVNRNYKSADGKVEADFIPIIAWRKQAENCAKYLSKGSRISVEGRIQVRTYDDKDGNRRWATEVIAEKVVFLETRKKQSSEDSDFGEEVPFDDEDLPF